MAFTTLEGKLQELMPCGQIRGFPFFFSAYKATCFWWPLSFFMVFFCVFLRGTKTCGLPLLAAYRATCAFVSFFRNQSSWSSVFFCLQGHLLLVIAVSFFGSFLCSFPGGQILLLVQRAVGAVEVEVLFSFHSN